MKILEQGIVCNDDGEGSGKYFVRYVQVLSDNTRTYVKCIALVVFLVHVVLMNSLSRFYRQPKEIGHNNVHQGIWKKSLVASLVGLLRSCKRAGSQAQTR